MIHPIILCGGRGTRLWPSSRETFPKQFAPVFGDRSPLQAMLAMMGGDAFDAPILATTEPFRYLAQDQAQAAGVWDARIMVEPEGRDTAAAVLSATLMIEDDPDAMILVAPVLHVAGDGAEFRAAIAMATEQVRKGAIVRFAGGAAEVQKQTAAALAKIVGAGGVSEDDTALGLTDRALGAPMTGLSLFRRKDLLAAFEQLAPDMVRDCRAALGKEAGQEPVVTLGAGYAKVAAMSFEAAILDRMPAVSTVSLEGGCTELSDWDAIWSAMEPDSDGVALSDGADAVSCRDTLLRSEDRAIRVLGVGLKNVVAVAMRDAVLMADRDHLHEIPAALKRIGAGQSVQAAEYPRYHRPWGWYESLIARDRFQVKRIMVKPGGVLSLQSHVHRSEHWIVVGGTAEVTVGETVSLIPENGHVYIPLGAVHRMANPGKVPMYLIEVQTGTYLGEDDIKRYEDIYDRC